MLPASSEILEMKTFPGAAVIGNDNVPGMIMDGMGTMKRLVH